MALRKRDGFVRAEYLQPRNVTICHFAWRLAGFQAGAAGSSSGLALSPVLTTPPSPRLPCQPTVPFCPLLILLSLEASSVSASHSPPRQKSLVFCPVFSGASLLHLVQFFPFPLCSFIVTSRVGRAIWFWARAEVWERGREGLSGLACQQTRYSCRANGGETASQRPQGRRP